VGFFAGFVVQLDGLFERIDDNPAALAALDVAF